MENVTHLLAKFCKNSDIFIDGAHNVAGAYALAKWAQQEKEKYKDIYIIAGFSKDKSSGNFLANFKNFTEIIAIKVAGEPYPEDPEIIAQIGKDSSLKICAKPDLIDALKYIDSKICSNVDKNLIIICGSLHLNRDVRKFAKFSYNIT